jgi:DNA-binding HxlR family transcriptional regulator
VGELLEKGGDRMQDGDSSAVVSYRQALEEAMGVLSGQWVPAVLTALAVGPLHFVELLAEINSVDERHGRRAHPTPLSSKVLARTLQRMGDEGLVLRHKDPSPHPSVWYEITEDGRTLLEALRPLAQWARLHRSTRLDSILECDEAVSTDG